MVRFRLILLPLVAAVSAPAFAAQYVATPVTPVETAMVVKDLRWSCAGETCSAMRTGTSPDANVCAAVARKLGALQSFAVAGQPFDAAKMEKCNSAAK
jgi:hydroxymethylpyrimidine/phosphomethylpyrimidine kinase